MRRPIPVNARFCCFGDSCILRDDKAFSFPSRNTAERGPGGRQERSRLCGGRCA
jgi:hypothetical protein